MSNFTFQNDGQILQYTNYFDSPEAQAGEFYLTWNAGVARLLVPDNQKYLLPEMRTAKCVEIIIIECGLQIIFDDKTDMPFAIVIAKEQTDRVLSKSEVGKKCLFSVYIRLGEKYQFEAVII